ncbi:TonB-linked SusC/RagA family outer membrane protein [Flavobacterium sp. 270]|uniref:SusC/RagA family TonB-linked outer membrane protein n=1 Tax=Flavobacterium sp. 270 TaxID=2512114 RepID=UPI001064F4B0|nr:TonB-dependent receptor [Flavobacterium sp. 270]TDW44578.1 TonB-linked SusC/RagA family outer membrane protein [Flavobacterium sp. 270]
MKNNKNANLLFLGGNYLRLSLILFMCFLFNSINAQNPITGKVVDNAGIPLPGANVIIKGTNKSTQTDFDGVFTIPAAPNSTLVFTYIGMDEVSVLVGTKTTYNISLKPSSQTLDQVIVVGYGTKKKSDVISSVASVKAGDLIKVATSDVGEMLRGKAAGVQVTLADGGPGSSSTIQIRGKKSINGSNEPIVIADGIVIGSINDINANDIASLEILKDAAAQSIYGARASNGVILITTKRGKTGKAKVSYNGFSGVQTINRNFDIYSGEEFAQLKREAYRTSNNGVYRPDNQVFTPLELESVQSGKYIDWEKDILNTGVTNNHSISVSSGTDKTSIFTSLNYINTTGVVPETDFEKVAMRINVDQRVNDWLKIGMNASLQFSESNNPNVGNILNNSINTSPLGRIYNDDGSYRQLPGGVQETPNPLIDIYETRTNALNRNDIMNVFLDINLLKGLTYKLNTSRRSWNYKEMSYNSSKSLSGIANSGQGSGQIFYKDNVEYQLSNIFNYNFKAAERNHFGATAVYEVTSSQYNEFKNVASRIPSDILGIYGLESAFLNTPTIAGSERSLVSFAGKLEYDFDNKYYFTVSGRADGSSVFGKNNKWGYFPAVNAAWNVYKEDFIKESVPVISNLKLRASYGKVGNQPQNPYQSMATANQRDYIINGVKVSGYVPGTQLSNPDLKWETSTQLNLAVDFGLFKNRLSGTVEVYDTDTSDLLIYETLNANTGYTNKLSNIGKVNNKGLEVTLNSELIKKKDFSLNLGATFTKNKNSIVSIYGKDANGDGKEDDAVGNLWFIGKPIDVYYQYKAVGIYQQGENIPVVPGTTLLPGDIKLYDADPSNGAVPNPDQDRVLTSKMPDWFGTVSLNMTYKRFDFSADIYTVQGITKDNPYLYGYVQGGSLRGVKNGIKQDYWTPENPGGNWPRPRDGNDPPYMYTLGLQDASYVRLQNVSLGFTLPENTLQSLGLTNLRLYVTGSNLVTITDFQSYSPEKNAGDYPEPVTCVIGLQVGF